MGLEYDEYQIAALESGADYMEIYNNDHEYDQYAKERGTHVWEDRFDPYLESSLGDPGSCHFDAPKRRKRLAA